MSRSSHLSKGHLAFHGIWYLVAMIWALDTSNAVGIVLLGFLWRQSKETCFVLHLNLFFIFFSNSWNPLGYLHASNSNLTPQNLFILDFFLSVFITSFSVVMTLGISVLGLSLKSATNWVVLTAETYFLIDLEARCPRYQQSLWQGGSFLLAWDSVLCFGPSSWSSLQNFYMPQLLGISCIPVGGMLAGMGFQSSERPRTQKSPQGQMCPSSHEHFSDVWMVLCSTLFFL